jgi:endoglucanase
MGNVLALKHGTDESSDFRLMLTAHIDEIGFMVTDIESNGLIKFTKVGGVDDRILPALRVKIGQKQVPGVIIWTPIHMGYSQNVVKADKLRIDVGASKKEGAKVKRGDRIAFDSQYMEIGEHILRGKSFDNRVGCSILIDILQGGPYPIDIAVAFTVQEEIGLRGAKVAAKALAPDIAIALEGTTAHDIPDPSADPDDLTVKSPACRLGSGPALTVMDNSMITDPRLLKFIRATADSNEIPYQLKTARGGGTDAGAIHISNAGVPSAVISVPCRYIHSPTALLNRNDYQHTLQLVQAIVNTVSPDTLSWDNL